MLRSGDASQVDRIGDVIRPDDAGTRAGEGIGFLHPAGVNHAHEAEALGVLAWVGVLDVKVDPPPCWYVPTLVICGTGGDGKADGDGLGVGDAEAVGDEEGDEDEEGDGDEEGDVDEEGDGDEGGGVDAGAVADGGLPVDAPGERRPRLPRG